MTDFRFKLAVNVTTFTETNLTAGKHVRVKGFLRENLGILILQVASMQDFEIIDDEVPSAANLRNGFLSLEIVEDPRQLQPPEILAPINPPARVLPTNPPEIMEPQQCQAAAIVMPINPEIVEQLQPPVSIVPINPIEMEQQLQSPARVTPLNHPEIIEKPQQLQPPAIVVPVNPHEISNCPLPNFRSAAIRNPSSNGQRENVAGPSNGHMDNFTSRRRLDNELDVERLPNISCKLHFFIRVSSVRETYRIFNFK